MRPAALLMGAALLSAALGFGFGTVSSWVHVIGLGACLLGLVTGGLLAFTLLLRGLRPNVLLWTWGIVCIVCGQMGVVLAEDTRFVDVWTMDLAQARMTADGVPAELVDTDAMRQVYTKLQQKTMPSLGQYARDVRGLIANAKLRYGVCVCV